MFKLLFWKDALERALKSAAQFAIGGWGLGTSTNAFDVDWMLGGGFAVTGFVLSILTSMASAPFGEGTSPSLIN